MAGNDRMIRVDGEKDDSARAVRGHLDHERIVGVEHGVAARRYGLNDATLHLSQLSGRVDVAQAEVIAVADVGDHGHVAVIESQAFA